MRLAVFGASGRTGRHVVDQALAAGHAVTAFARDPASLAQGHARLEVVKGDVRDAAQVSLAMAGQDAVVSVLGPRNGTAPDAITAGLGHIIDAMRRHGVRRIVTVATSACVVPGDRRQVEAALAARMARALIGHDVRAKEEQLGLLGESGLDWTALRPARLTDGPPTGRYGIGDDLQLGFAASLARADLATAVLDQAAAGARSSRTPFCAARR